MDKAHAKACEAIESFVAQATSTQASPRFIANLISSATSSPSAYVFAELLEIKAVQGLRSPDTPQEYRAWLRVLEIFAWGTWKEYETTPGLPALNEAQQMKLRLLTLITLARQHAPLTYDIAMQELSLDSAPSLEALVRTAIYADLLKAKLAPTANPPSVYVTATAPLRDVAPDTVSDLQSMLEGWRERIASTVKDVEAEIRRVHTAAAERQRQQIQDLQEKQGGLMLPKGPNDSPFAPTPPRNPQPSAESSGIGFKRAAADDGAGYASIFRARITDPAYNISVEQNRRALNEVFEAKRLADEADERAEAEAAAEAAEANGEDEDGDASSMDVDEDVGYGRSPPKQLRTSRSDDN